MVKYLVVNDFYESLNNIEFFSNVLNFFFSLKIQSEKQKAYEKIIYYKKCSVL